MNCKLIALLAIAAGVLAKKRDEVQEGTSQRWSQSDLFLYGMISGGFVSAIGFIAAFLLIGLNRVLSTHTFTTIIQILFAFSCGALLGETMHVLSQAYSSKKLQHDKIALTFIAAIISFVFLERLMEKSGISHSHWHSDEEEENHNVKQKRQLEHHKGKQLSQGKEATGFLNLISSLLHNFIDGLAIGVAYSLGNPNQFLPVTIGIIAHEIPREMGDVAILLKSRFNERETILSNGLVNLISIVGVYIGLNSQGISFKTRQYALVFVAGNFLYIASDIWRNLFHNQRSFVSILQAAGLLWGVYITLAHEHHH